MPLFRHKYYNTFHNSAQNWPATLYIMTRKKTTNVYLLTYKNWSWFWELHKQLFHKLYTNFNNFNNQKLQQDSQPALPITSLGKGKTRLINESESTPATIIQNVNINNSY